MSDGAGSGTVGDPPAMPVPAGTGKSRWPRWASARRRVTELLIVFVGVYAAFLLNRLDSDRRDARRRAQVLDALEQEVSTNTDELRGDMKQATEVFADFDRRLAAGEMPPLSVSFTDSGYSSSDDATLLQSGGLELLDMPTVESIRVVNGLERSLLGFTHDQFELSLMELANHEQAEFYDPATRQLKKRYDWYPRLQHLTLSQAQALLAAEEKLLAHLRAIQHPGTPSATSPTPVPSPAGRTTPSRSPAASTPAA